MAKIWKKYRQARGEQRFSIWLQWAKLAKKQYQIKALEWCQAREISPHNRGGIFADEMGLGKTIVMLGNIYCRPVQRTLIILPNNLLSQWDICINKYIVSLTYRWLANKDYYIYHGARRADIEELLKKRIVVTTYGTMVSRLKTLKQIDWDRIVYDEAHHLRDSSTQIFKAAKSLKGKIQWFITGTPIQNRIGDLQSLCYLLGFTRDDYRTPEGLQAILSSHMLRRTKKEVGIYIPRLKSYIKQLPWISDEEEALSSHIHASTNFGAVHLNSIGNPLQLHPLAIFTRCRQMCVQPRAIKKAIDSGNAFNFLEDVQPQWPKMTVSKITGVVSKLARRAGNRRRKLVFCHYRLEIDEIAQRLRAQGIIVGIVDGRTTQTKRNSLFAPLMTKALWNELLPCVHTRTRVPIYDKVMEFLKPEVLLVQIQTASEGLNLQDFCEVYFTSPHWNAALEDQAVARCHRLGQKLPVKVFRFIMEPHGGGGMTLDTYCANTQKHKRELIQEVLN